MRTLLVALDGSARQDGVLNAAASLARHTGARLVLFRCVGLQPGIPIEAYAMSPDDVPKLLEDRARRDLEQLCAALPADARSFVRVAIGTPWNPIDSAARSEDADMIIIGSHGYGAIDRLLGTTAAKVVNHADRTVLVVRAPERLLR